MKKICRNKHWKINKQYNSDKILYLLIDRSSYINNNYLFWENKKGWHRDYDLPSVIFNNNNISYHINGTIYKIQQK